MTSPQKFASKIGIVGGGQLGRMLALAAYPIGVEVVLLDPAIDACGAQVTTLLQGSYDDPAALKDLASKTEAITFEFENVNAAAIDGLRSEGVSVFPGPEALLNSQDRILEKNLFRSEGIETVPFEFVAAGSMVSQSD